MNILDKAKLEICLSRFDFEKVHRTMTKINWEWHNTGVPTIEQLEATAEQLLRSANKDAQENESKASTHATGGFQAVYADETFTLSFIITESDSYIDVEDDDMPKKTKKKKTPPANDSFSHIEI